MSSKRKKARCILRHNEREYEQKQISNYLDEIKKAKKEEERIKEVERLEQQRKDEEFAKPLIDSLNTDDPEGRKRFEKQLIEFGFDFLIDKENKD